MLWNFTRHIDVKAYSPALPLGAHGLHLLLFNRVIWYFTRIAFCASHNLSKRSEKEKLPNCIYTRHFPQFTPFTFQTHSHSLTQALPLATLACIFILLVCQKCTHTGTHTHLACIVCIYLHLYFAFLLHFSHASIAATKFFLLNSSLNSKHVCMDVCACVCVVSSCRCLLSAAADTIKVHLKC